MSGRNSGDSCKRKQGKASVYAGLERETRCFLKLNEQDILQNSGRVSHEVAVGEKEYESFRVEQDKRFESDFDRMVKNIN
ncbi:MAG: hypothetical protein OIN66_07700 [Candidatus Methanoperedens sp.]|nr:hypothetical protein [Candidatus Methanoperedens sp.]